MKGAQLNPSMNSACNEQTTDMHRTRVSAAHLVPPSPTNTPLTFGLDSASDHVIIIGCDQNFRTKMKAKLFWCDNVSLFT